MALNKHEVTWRDDGAKQERSFVYYTARHPKHRAEAEAVNRKLSNKDRTELAAYSIACEAGTAYVSAITVTEVGV